MTYNTNNTCARCGVPIPEQETLCKVCAKEDTLQTRMRPCPACGAANPQDGQFCFECKTPLSADDDAEGQQAMDDDVTNPEIPMVMARRAELQVLVDCLALCLDEQRAGGAIVTGEPGMGATTLLKNFADRVTDRVPKERVYYLLGREGAETYALIRRMLRRRFRLESGIDPLTCRLSLINQVGKIIGHESAALVTETAHLLGYLAGVSFPQSPALKEIESDAELMKRRLTDAFVRFLEADCAREPLVLIFDDLQKSTAEGQRFLVEALTRIRKVPLCTVLGGRPEVGDLVSNEKVVRVNFEPLDDETMHSLFGAFLPELISPPPELIEATIGRSAGNPGSLRELCSLLVESGVVDTSSSPWTADVSKLVVADIPVRLIDALKARFEQLEPRDRTTLEHAAIIGEVFWDEAVVALLRQSKPMHEKITAAQIWADDSEQLTVMSALERCVERQFVVQLPDIDLPGSVKYAFARSGIRAEILEDIDYKTKRRGHYLAAQWLERACHGSLTVLHEQVAEHWEAAGEHHRAAMATLFAARYARSRYLNLKAIRLFERGIALADSEDRSLLAEAYHDVGCIHELLGDYDAAEACFTKMLWHSWILTSRSKAGAALNKIGRLYRARGDGAAARAYLNRGMALFNAAGDEKGTAACLADLGELARREGSYDRAYKLVSQALELQRRFDNKLAIAVCLHSLGHIEAARARYSQAERHLEEALKLRRAAGDKGGMAHTLSALAIVLFSRGDSDKAIARWEAALTLAEEVGDRRMLAVVHNNLGEALREQGKLDAAMGHFQACEKIVTTLDDRLLHAEVSRNMGISLQRKGELETAREYLMRSLELSRQIGGRELEGLAYRALGELGAATVWDASNTEGEDEPAAHFEKALEIFRAIGNEFEVARTLHAIGNRLLERGEVDASRAKLEEAQAIFERIESKAGDKVSRTISEILSQVKVKPEEISTRETNPEAERKSDWGALMGKLNLPSFVRDFGRRPAAGPKESRSRQTDEGYPDMTDEVELTENEEE